MSTYKKDELLKNNPKIVANAIQIPVLSNVIKISAGFYRSAAIDKTGQVWVWGFGTGDLGSSIDDQFASKDGVGVNKQAHAPLATNVAAGSSLEFVVGKDGKIWKRGFYSDGVVRYGDYQFSEINEVDHPRVISANYGAIFGIGSDGQGWQRGSGIGYDLKSPAKFHQDWQRY